MVRILHVDDDDQSRRVVCRILQGLMGHDVADCDNAASALDLHREEPFPIILSDIRMPGMSGLDLLKKIKQDPSLANTDIVLLTGFADVDTAVAALRNGASDFLRKPVQAKELVSVIERLVQLNMQGKEEAGTESPGPVSTTVSEPETEIRFPDGTTLGLFSSELRSLAQTAIKLHADRDVSVLIEGETGVGKEQFARLVHYGTEGDSRPFVTINCAAISPLLMESELFGYEAGAFTGARRNGAKGKFEAAVGGTLFLDEIGEMPLEMQPKLLRVLQERVLYRVGGNKAIPVDVRIIAASNRNLEDMVAAGTFRQDLYYRLNVGRLTIPPLRRQTGCIGPLAQQYLIALSAKKNTRFQSIHPDALSLLENHTWPGNIRELRNVIERTILLYDAKEIRPEHLHHLEIQSGDTPVPQRVQGPVSFNLPEEELNLERLELGVIRTALARFDGNITRTAEYLGISRFALKRRLEKANL